MFLQILDKGLLYYGAKYQLPYCRLPFFQTGIKLTIFSFSSFFQGSRSLEYLLAYWQGASQLSTKTSNPPFLHLDTVRRLAMQDITDTASTLRATCRVSAMI